MKSRRRPSKSSAPLKIFLLPDTHAPYQAKRPFRVACNVIAGWQPDRVVCLGDFLDLFCVGAWRKDPRVKKTLKAEMRGARAAFDLLDQACIAGGVRQKDYLEGNHETRLERYLIDKAPELLGTVDWREMLDLKGRGWVSHGYQDWLRIGDLNLCHDIGRAGVAAARQSLLDAGDNIAFGHTHRLSVQYQGQTFGNPHVGATLGWLGDPKAIDYRHRMSVLRDSIHGFGTVHMLPNGHFWLTAVPIIAGRAVVDGVVYSA